KPGLSAGAGHAACGTFAHEKIDCVFGTHMADSSLMSWLLVERLVQVSDHDIGMPWNVKEIREDLGRLPIFHLRLWRLCLNLLFRCFNPCVREINLRRGSTPGSFVSLGPPLPHSTDWRCRVARGCDTENYRVNSKARVFIHTFFHRLSRCRRN